MSDERTVELTQDEFDLVWELLLATHVAMKNGNLNAHRGLLGHGPADNKLTEKLRARTMKIAGKMANLVATGDEPIVLEVKPMPKKRWWFK